MPYSLYQAYPNYNQYYYQPQQNVQQTPQIQNGGFVMVKNINEAMNYPVAPGNSVTFKNENQPYIYTKTLGFSQLDQPIFEIFKLVKEENEVQANDVPIELPTIEYLPLAEAETMKAELSILKEKVNFFEQFFETDAKESDSK